MTEDHRDLVIEALADSEHDLAATCASLRETLHAAVQQLHEQQVETEKLRARYERLIIEYRSYRAATISEPRRAA
jgi:hypothetical protein